MGLGEGTNGGPFYMRSLPKIHAPSSGDSRLGFKVSVAAFLPAGDNLYIFRSQLFLDRQSN